MKVSIPGRKMQEEKLIILTCFQLSVTFSDDNCLLASYFPFLYIRGVVCAYCPDMAHRLTHCNTKQSKMKLSLRLSLLWVLYGIFLKGLRSKTIEHGKLAMTAEPQQTIALNSTWLARSHLENDLLCFSDASNTLSHLSSAADTSHWLVSRMPFNCLRQQFWGDEPRWYVLSSPLLRKLR